MTELTELRPSTASFPEASSPEAPVPFAATDFRWDLAEKIAEYGHLLGAKNYIPGPLGNIAVRVPHPYDPEHGVVYTKHGVTADSAISLEEMGPEHVVVTDCRNGDLLYGDHFPNEGHGLNREILLQRPDVNCVIHVHADAVIGFMCATGWAKMRYISRDLLLALGTEVKIEAPGVNPELDPPIVRPYIKDTNLLIMPDHGATALGGFISQAYHRLNSFVAQTRIIKTAYETAALLGTEVPFMSQEKIDKLLAASQKLNRNVGGSSYKPGLW
jgi:ribulose-5-phosphate 4-epimerase/fuculose-1-phosphate aldolase